MPGSVLVHGCMMFVSPSRDWDWYQHNCVHIWLPTKFQLFFFVKQKPKVTSNMISYKKNRNPMTQACFKQVKI